jgi:hypothetical protein
MKKALGALFKKDHSDKSLSEKNKEATLVPSLLDSPTSTPSATTNKMFKFGSENVLGDAPAPTQQSRSRLSTAGSSTGSLQAPTPKEMQSAIRENRDSNPFKKENYMFLRVIGSGSYGVVKEAEFIASGERVAVKMIEKKRMINREERMRSEIEILTKVNHRNLLSLLDWGFGKQYIYLVTELYVIF